MDHIDFLYVRVRTEELLARLGESEAIAVHAGGLAAARPEAVAPIRYSLLRRLRRAIRMRRRSIRVLSDATR